MTDHAWKIEEFKTCLIVLKEEQTCFSCSNQIPAEYQALDILKLHASSEEASYVCPVCMDEHLDQRLTRFLDQNQVNQLRSQRVAQAL